MKIAVLNGSPKGELSVTMQYVKCLQVMFKDVEFRIMDAAAKINKLEQDEKYFSALIEEIASSDGVIWGFPLYYLLVPSQYKRFIELVYINNS
ncbi:MAG TPA: NAD(P)H-dependent oxidoreductase, partial [Smithellaceae bacterium]|nr:NAD(P)H-dependent oxidoreductase [Smithellaceae bacterium]